MAIKVYKNKIDLRVLADKLDFMYFMRQVPLNGVGFNKKKTFTLYI